MSSLALPVLKRTVILSRYCWIVIYTSFFKFNDIKGCRGWKWKRFKRNFWTVILGSGDTTRTCVRQLTDMSHCCIWFLQNCLPLEDFNCFSLNIAWLLESWNSRYTTIQGLNLIVCPFVASELCEWKRLIKSEVYPIYIWSNFSEYKR